MIKVKQPKLLPKIITQDQASLLLKSSTGIRDRFLIALLYETGLRIGQALELHHEDIKSWDNEIDINTRFNNENESRNKSGTPHIVHVSSDLMALYSQYVISECKSPS